MHTEVLQELGLSLNESRVYEALLETGEANVQTIATTADVHRRNVYDSLNKLKERGLASELFVDGEKNFKPADPNRILELVKEQEERVHDILPDLRARYEHVDRDVEAYIHKGIEGFKTYLQDILETEETVYFIGAKAFWLDPRLEHYLARFQKERKNKGIEFKHLFDQEVKEKTPEILEQVGPKYKFLPGAYSSHTAVDIFGPYVVTFVGEQPGILPDEPIQFVMKNKKLADGYRKFFHFMWEHAEDP